MTVHTYPASEGEATLRVPTFASKEFLGVIDNVVFQFRVHYDGIQRSIEAKMTNSHGQPNRKTEVVLVLCQMKSENTNLFGLDFVRLQAPY